MLIGIRTADDCRVYWLSYVIIGRVYLAPEHLARDSEDIVSGRSPAAAHRDEMRSCLWRLTVASRL